MSHFLHSAGCKTSRDVAFLRGSWLLWISTSWEFGLSHWSACKFYNQPIPVCRGLSYIGNQCCFFWNTRRSPLPTSAWLKQTTRLPISCLLPGAGFYHLIGQLVSSPLHLLQLIAHVRVLGHGSAVGWRGAWVGASGTGWPRNLERSRFDHMSVCMYTRCCAQLGEALNGPHSLSPCLSNLLSWKRCSDRRAQNQATRVPRCLVHSGARYPSTHEALLKIHTTHVWNGRMWLQVRIHLTLHLFLFYSHQLYWGIIRIQKIPHLWSTQFETSWYILPREPWSQLRK